MKILYLYDKMPKVYQTYLSILLKKIKKQANVTSFAYEKETGADIQFKTYSFLDLYQRFLYKIKLSKIKSYDLKLFKNYDIIHLQHSYLFKKLLPLKQISPKTKLIITLRGGDTYVKPWLSKKWENFFKKESVNVDAFITMSNHQKEYLNCKWGVPNHKIYVIPISFGEKTKAKPKYPNTDKLKLVSAFRMTWEKNITDCLKFCMILKKKGINFSYDIYGDGDDLGQLYYLVDKYKLINQIKIHGKVSNSLFKQELIKYDVFLQFSLSESFGATLVEAQSQGLPCIVSSAGGLPEAIKDNETGFVDFEDDLNLLSEKCIDLWNDKNKYFNFSKNAIDFSNHNFSVKEEIKSLNRLYTKL